MADSIPIEVDLALTKPSAAVLRKQLPSPALKEPGPVCTFRQIIRQSPAELFSLRTRLNSPQGVSDTLIHFLFEIGNT
jgi:hypothetical protein